MSDTFLSPNKVTLTNATTGHSTTLEYDDDGFLVLPPKVKFRVQDTGETKKFWLEPTDGLFHEL